MSLIFVNGSAPDYLGFLFSDQVGLLDKIESTLIAAGWATYNRALTGDSLTMTGFTDNGHSCNVEFSIKDYTGAINGKYLIIRGWHEPTKVTGSPDDTHRAIFIDGSLNRLWLTAEHDSGCIAVYGADGSMSGYHFGFLERIDENDQDAWMIGNIISNGYVSAYVSKSKYGGTNWRRLSSDYGATSSYNTSNFEQYHFMYPATCLDHTMRGQVHDQNAYWNSSQNPWYNPFNGRLNYDGKAIIDRYSYIEGRGSMTNYSAGAYEPLYFRGFIKNAFTGVASFNSGTQLTDVYSGYRILSVGPAWWQGMRIF